jgi:hypothetical protein
LRTRAISGATFTATNVASNYTLTVNISSTLDGSSVSPNNITLRPNESKQITVNFQTAPLETLPVGVLNSSLNFVVTATPVIIPVAPPPPPPPLPPQPVGIYGCTDPAALNYTPSATIDNGTCIPKIYGCTNINALNFNPRANTEDGSCTYKAPPAEILGCTNKNALNYNSKATQDDGSCIDIIIGCMDKNATNYNPLANTICEGCCRYKISDLAVGCTDPNAKNFDGYAVIDNGSCQYYKVGCTNPKAFNYDPAAEKDNGTCKFTGCTDPLANNYVQGENLVSCTNCCTYDVKLDPCLQIGKITQTRPANNQDPSYTNVCRLIQDTIVGGCRESCTDEYTGKPAKVGCTDSTAINYNPDATENDNSCMYVTGCMDKSAINYNPHAVRDSGECRYETIVYGCMDPTATNYNSSATRDSGKCTYDRGTGNGGGQGICGECMQNSDCFYRRDGSFDPTRVCDELTRCCVDGKIYEV